MDPVPQPNGTPKPATPPAAATPVADPPKPATPAPDDKLAALVAKEKAFVQDKLAFAGERDSFKKEKSEYDAWKAAKADALKNPEALAKATWGDDWYEKLTEYRLNGNKVTPELIDQRLDARLSDFEKKQQQDREQQVAAERERIATQEKEIIQTFRTDTVDWVKKQGDEYELINLLNAHDLVPRLVEKTFNETSERDAEGKIVKGGRLLTAKEAADLVEKDLIEQAKKANAAKKFQAKSAVPATPALEKRTDPAQPRTVTNDLAARTTPAPKETDFPSDSERVRAAIAAGEAARKARLVQG